LALLNFTIQHKNAVVMMGNQFYRCKVCGQTTENKFVIKLSNENETCMCIDCHKEIHDILNGKGWLK
jgi:hypothetical protein